MDYSIEYDYERLTELIDGLTREHRKYGDKWFSPNHNLEILSACLYHYSNYWYQTKTADNELKFLEAAAGDVTANLSAEKDKKLLSEHDITLQPEARTLALCCHAAKEEKNRDIQKMYYSMLYQVTGEEEIKKWLSSEHI